MNADSDPEVDSRFSVSPRMLLDVISWDFYEKTDSNPEVDSRDVQQIVAPCHRSWRNREGDTACAMGCRRRSSCGYGRPCGLATVEVPQIQFIAGVSGHSSSPETGTLSAWVWRR